MQLQFLSAKLTSSNEIIYLREYECLVHFKDEWATVSIHLEMTPTQRWMCDVHLVSGELSYISELRSALRDYPNLAKELSALSRVPSPNDDHSQPPYSNWFVFQPYQKARVINFVQPLSNIHGSGYNVYQSTIAIGSGQIFGKGVGFGTQSRLKFLPEYETDFIFAAFSEEWGFVGVMILFILLGLIIWRILRMALLGTTNFEILFGLGLAIYFMSHFIVNVGMNLGIMPVTGITLPFMSYGGSHLLTEFMGLGILMGMSRYGRVAHRDDMHNEFLGI